MIIIIQCASKKNRDGYFIEKGQRIIFVAKPNLKQSPAGISYKNPDELTSTDSTYREEVIKYNQNDLNPMNLYRAIDLYDALAYKKLDIYGKTGAKTFILSAGWGLVSSDFRLPSYDITLGQLSKDEKYKQRSFKNDTYEDFNMLSSVPEDEELHFFGGVSYLPLLYKLINDVRCRKIIHQATINEKKPGYDYETYPRNFTNWHYQAVLEFLAGKYYERK